MGVVFPVFIPRPAGNPQVLRGQNSVGPAVSVYGRAFRHRLAGRLDPPAVQAEPVLSVNLFAAVETGREWPLSSPSRIFLLPAESLPEPHREACFPAVDKALDGLGITQKLNIADVFILLFKQRFAAAADGDFIFFDRHERVAVCQKRPRLLHR